MKKEKTISTNYQLNLYISNYPFYFLLFSLLLVSNASFTFDGKEPAVIFNNSPNPSKEIKEIPIVNIEAIPINIKHGNHRLGDFILVTRAKAFVVSEASGLYDYYFIAQEGIFSPNKDLSDKHIFIHKYIMTADPDNTALLFKSAPSTTEGETEISHSIEFGVGVESSPGGSGSISVSRSKTITIPDLRIQNLVDPLNGHAEWVFAIHNLNRKAKKSSLISMSTFQPSTQWVWKRPHTNVPFRFQSRLAIGYDKICWTRQRIHKAVSVDWTPIELAAPTEKEFLKGYIY